MCYILCGNRFITDSTMIKTLLQVQIDEMKHAPQLSSLLMLRMKETQNAFQKSEDDVTVSVL